SRELDPKLAEDAAPKLAPRPQPLGQATHQVFNRALVNEKFARLWAGDRSDYADRSPSEADAAFIMHAARNGATKEQADALMRQSGLYRPDRWDTRNASGTYGTRTIDQAFDLVEVRVPIGLDASTAEGAMATVC